jgi:hypothetical protein
MKKARIPPRQSTSPKRKNFKVLPELSSRDTATSKKRSDKHA